MKPIPAPSSQDESSPPSASDLIKATPSGFTNVNRRSAQSNVNRAYPLLLVISTAVAIFFAFMYINKPVVVAGADSDDSISDKTPANEKAADNNASLLPETDTLPGDGQPATGTGAGNPLDLTTAPIHSRYEETNMRVQHILTATSNDGHVSRIDLEVPVLYQSRQLRWSPTEVAEANQLMLRLMDYQDKSSMLKSEGEQLLADWNTLIGKSIPASKLRADSPSIPDNQHSTSILSKPTEAGSTGGVEIDSQEDKP